MRLLYFAPVKFFDSALLAATPKATQNLSLSETYAKIACRCGGFRPTRIHVERDE